MDILLLIEMIALGLAFFWLFFKSVNAFDNL
jgi:hypothetical protein